MKELIYHLRPLSQIRSLKKGANILFQGEIPRKAFIVRTGVVRVYTITSSGEEAIAAFFCKDDIFPIPWLLNTTTSSLFYYEAASDVQLLVFSKDDFLNALNQDTKLLWSVLTYLNTQYTSMLLRITGLEQSRAIEKISYTFYYLVFRYGIQKEPGVFAVDIKLTHSMLASLTGLTRESATKNIKILKTKNIVEQNNLKYVIYKEKLENFIGEDGFRDLNLQ